MDRSHSYDKAQSFVSEVVDKSVATTTEVYSPGLSLNAASIDLGNGKFTNSYDLVFDASLHPEIAAFDTLTSTYDFMTSAREYTAATSGGFFYLADQGSGSPRQLALNLSVSRGNLRSLPVLDREAVVAGHSGLEVRALTALGSLSLDGQELDWSGSLTDYDTDVKVFGNGNVIVNHEQDQATGSRRILDESSRFTSVMGGEGMVDIGFIGRGRNKFIGAEFKSSGGVDIFVHDFVLRCPEKYAKADLDLEIHTIGGLALSRFEGGAFSAGPMLNIADFSNHAINRDLSLGSRPPFEDVSLARTVLYKTVDGLTHIRLFDGRPGSLVFPGVTPKETVEHILSEQMIEWGCFLDPGQSAKLCINDGLRTESYGNRHYMRWPDNQNPIFLWTPQSGRPVGNVIALY